MSGDLLAIVWLYVAVGVTVFIFFFQAEDGIRDVAVTGVQTCALPIYAAVRRHRPLAGVVGRYREAQIVPEALDEGAQVADARVDVLARVEGVPDAEHRGRLRHQLHEPPRALSGHRSRVESRLRPDDRPDETLRHGVSRRRAGH